ncbi:MAG: transcription termination factor NusA [Clostridiales bacterium]|nr:transcription termination factor NusA [Clostridiales bacterium]
MDKKELVTALNLVVKEKGIDKEIIYEAIEASLLTACKKNYGPSQNARVEVNRETGDIKVFASKEVVEEVYDSALEVSLEEAREISPSYEIGDFVEFEVTPKNFDRISAQTAKQVFVQKFREAEREKLYNEYIVKEKDIDTAIVQRTERRSVIVSLGKMEAMLPFREQIPGEEYRFNDRIKVYILEVRQTPKGPQINVSRTHYELVKRLFELEVPEIYDGTVEIKSIAREAGSRTKMAVYSKNPEVDPVGACVGHNGSRVNVIVEELKGEKIDIINWSEDPGEFIRAALNPAKVIAVAIEDTETEKLAKVVVADNQLSLAIGREGQNVRLAAKLTGRKIDIKSEAQARATNFIDFTAVDGEEAPYESDEFSDDYDDYDDDYDDYDENEEYDDYEDSGDYDDGDYDDKYDGEYEDDSEEYYEDDSEEELDTED